MILDNYKQFIEEIYSRLLDLGIDTTQLKIDHLGYQADSVEDYNKQLEAIKDTAELVSEEVVGERHVAILKLNGLLAYQNNIFRVIEIFEPMQNQKVKSAWEHIEFLQGDSLNYFQMQYPDLKWDTSKLNRDRFPMLILNLGDGLRAKFPKLGVLEELEKQKAR